MMEAMENENAEPTYLSPSDTAFYDTHSTETLHNLLAQFISSGAYIAMNSGPDHPLTTEYTNMIAAVTHQLMKRDGFA